MNAPNDIPTPVPANAPWRDFKHISLKRSLMAFAVGAGVGLAMAGTALFTARGTSTLVVPAEDVALVNQQPIARSDYYLQLKNLYDTDFTHATAQQRQAVLDQMIREELFVQRGKELDESSVDVDVRSAMVSAVEQSIAADVVASRPTDEALQTWYHQHQDRYSSEGTMTVRDLVFPPANADAADKALKGGQAVDAIAAEYGGKDSGRVTGEEFYFAARIHLGDAMFNVAKTLADGAASAPLPSSDGAHILYMAKNTPPVPWTFDEARAKVQSDYQAFAITRVQAADERFLRKRANILIAQDMR